MCRLLGYLGEPIALDHVLFGTDGLAMAHNGHLREFARMRYDLNRARRWTRCRAEPYAAATLL